MAYAMKFKRARGVLALSSLLLLLLFPEPSTAQKSSFRNEFIINYTSNRFQLQVLLVQANKDIIPGEIKALVAEAMVEGKPFDERMALLDIAQAMASMHSYWNHDPAPLVEVEMLVKMEVEKERQRKAEREKWNKYERFVGNFIMKEHEAQMKAEGLTPVIYPHWVHRIWFECKVCHDGIFKMRRGANDISQKHLMEGAQCAVCHDNEMAFGADKKEDCQRCHLAGTAEAESLYDLDNIDHKRLKEVAEGLGARWSYEDLPGGKMPLDRFGNIDWLELKKKNIFNPIISLDGGAKDEIRDNQIIFESSSPTLNDVLFSHKVHSSWVNCSTCHPNIFIDELGGNDMKMSEMAQGEFCGHCHGRVSFSFADCLRCHSQPKGQPVDGALIHKLTH